ncbi:MAG TPA: CDP-diacylglycerol--glycerol-3-phosphate 3-phosphatidyltransferase [Thermoanaerobaculia bacterium]|jgi:CDP-diacylglycerol--glycerol-3-phosphate 3-phosphatidyltransferase|nr:CDP-diacylglycerol--glycerol-3-phosphate 3-phosphatidyltransferase [Thermoanaerobaculia bacterium]
MLNLPNLLSICRILLVPPLVVVLLTKFEDKEWWGLGLFLLAAIMDFFDGYVARRRRQVTRLGTLLDPAADKILISAAFISLVEMDPSMVPAWMVVVIVAREFAVSALRSVAAAENLVIPAGFSGKLKTVVQIVAVAVLIIHNQLPDELRHASPISLWAAVLISVYSGVEYFVRFRRYLLAGEIAPPVAASSTRGDSA